MTDIAMGPHCKIHRNSAEMTLPMPPHQAGRGMAASLKTFLPSENQVHYLGDVDIKNSLREGTSYRQERQTKTVLEQSVCLKENKHLTPTLMFQPFILLSLTKYSQSLGLNLAGGAHL